MGRLLEIEKEMAERKQAEDKIRAILQEKELLLKEVHHRIKNNMSPIMSLVNELMTNAMKHAFAGRDAGSIGVSVSAQDDHVTLVIEDDGNEIPESVDIANSNGFWLQLVAMLTAQLDGTVRIERWKGARFILEFDA